MTQRIHPIVHEDVLFQLKRMDLHKQWLASAAIDTLVKLNRLMTLKKS